jgi:hypothetical protein
MAALQAGDPRDEDPPLPAAQHEPVEPRPDDGDKHDRNPPMITGQLACRGRRQQLERDTADDDHDIRRGVDDDPPGQQTPIPPPARTALRIFHDAAALSHALERFDPTGPDSLHERLEVLLVLIGVALGELGDRSVERVVVAEVLADGDRIS